MTNMVIGDPLPCGCMNVCRCTKGGVSFSIDHLLHFESRPAGCPHCSGQMSQVYHDGPCPRVKAIEYYPTGAIKRVEYRSS